MQVLKQPLEPPFSPLLHVHQLCAVPSRVLCSAVGVGQRNQLQRGLVHKAGCVLLPFGRLLGS